MLTATNISKGARLPLSRSRDSPRREITCGESNPAVSAGSGCAFCWVEVPGLQVRNSMRRFCVMLKVAVRLQTQQIRRHVWFVWLCERDGEAGLIRHGTPN